MGIDLWPVWPACVWDWFSSVASRIGTRNRAVRLVSATVVFLSFWQGDGAASISGICLGLRVRFGLSEFGSVPQGLVYMAFGVAAKFSSPVLRVVSFLCLSAVWSLWRKDSLAG